MTQYSNPRKSATIVDWPIGGNLRGEAVFLVESNKRGERCTRTTEKRDGTRSKPKAGIYHDACRIVDGDDGKTYILGLSRGYGQIGVMQGNLKFAHESFHQGDERFSEVLALLTE
jgi:hypothetical protein